MTSPTFPSRRSPPAQSSARREGMILVIVLVVISMLALAALSFSELMLSEREAAELAMQQVQARASAESAVELARRFVEQDSDSLAQAGGWYDNPQFFRGALVADGAVASQRSRFAVIAPAQEDGRYAGIRFGLEDECARLNLNTVLWADQQVPGSGRQLLMGLPGMTEDVADAILDWMDADPEPREFGAEDEYYSALDPPYHPKNGPLETIEELLLVRGVYPEMLFGSDANRNGVVDGNEPEPLLVSDETGDASLDRGWAAYLTLWSLESNLTPEGQPRINLNQDDLETLYEQVSEVAGVPAATFVVACRQAKEAPKEATAPTNPALGKLDFTRKGQYKFQTVVELIGTQTSVTFEGETTPKTINSPFPNLPGGLMDDYMPKIMDYMTTREKPFFPGRINVNQAPRELLLGIPGVTSEQVDQILSMREQDVAQAEPHLRYETWLLAEGIVTLDEMKALMPYVTGGGGVYRCQAVGYFDGKGPDARFEAVIDATNRPSRIVFWRDMTHLGRGYPREVLGIGLLE